MIEEEKTSEGSKEKDLLKRIRERYKIMQEADHDNRRLAMDDMKFIHEPGAQWDANMKKERGQRPCYEFNKLRVTVKRIVNDMRANRPAGKVRGVEDNDKKTAEIYEGLIRNIWNTSDGDTVIDTAAEYQVGGGYAAWRICTKYASDTSFDQDIVIEPILNPYCLFSDPSCKDPLKRDAMDFILTEKISNESFKARWPKAERIAWESSEFDDDEDWQDDEETRVCEYWWKEPVDKKLYQLVDGSVIDAESPEASGIPPEAIRRERIVKSHKVMTCIASGDAILEGPSEHAGSMLPFVVVYGEWLVIDGKTQWFGIARFAKDAQRSYNVSRTAITETIAQTPKAKFWATATQANGHTDAWAEADLKNFPFMLYNADPMAPGTPQRMGGADVPVALIQESQIASEEIKAVTGIFSPDLGAGNQASSGRQEIARQQQGQIATFNYMDNMSKAIRRTYEILIDLIPKIYDTERELRILGSDGAESYTKINTFVPGPDGLPVKINDLSQGRYDVTVTSGPGFATRRQEAVETYQNLLQANPQIMTVAGDLIFKSMDLPYAEDIADRMQALLPPPIQQMLGQGENVSPEAQAVMAQAQQAMAMVQQQGQQIQQAAAALQEEQAQTDQQKAELQKLLADIQTKQKQAEAAIAQDMAALVQKEASIKIMEANLNAKLSGDEMQGAVNEQKDQLVMAAAQIMDGIRNEAANFSSLALGALNEIQSKKEQKKPKVIRLESRREGGKLVAVPIYEEETEPADLAQPYGEIPQSYEQ